jgi:hypothetical protein
MFSCARRGSSLTIAGIMLALIMLVALVLAPSRALASPSLSQQSKQLAEQIAGLDAKIDVAVTSYAQATARLTTIGDQIRTNRRLLEVTRRNLKVASAALSASVVAAYKQQSANVLDVLMSSSTFGDMVSGLEMVRRVNSQDAAIVSNLAAYRKQLLQRSTALFRAQSEAQRVVAERAADVQAIRAALADRRRTVASARAGVVALAQKHRAHAVSDASPVVPGRVGGRQWWPLMTATAGKYGLSAGGMFRLMMIESGGSATASNGGAFLGLYQYAPSTWAGSWNPWRHESIFAGVAQIRATALALHLGYGPAWWTTSYAWAFSSY